MVLTQGGPQLEPPHGRAAGGRGGDAPGRADGAGHDRSADPADDVAGGGEQLAAQAAPGRGERAEPGRRAGAEAGARDAERDRHDELRGGGPDVTEDELAEPVRHQQQRRAPQQRADGLPAAEEEAERSEPLRGLPVSKDLLEMGVGSVLELDRYENEPVDLLVNDKLVARGEVVVVEDRFGIRITETISERERLKGFGG